MLLQRFDSERPGHAQPLFVDPRLIVERFGVGRFVVGESFQRDMRDGFVDKSVANVAAFGVVEFVVGIGGGEQARFGDADGNAGGVNCDPAGPIARRRKPWCHCHRWDQAPKSPGSVVIKRDSVR